MFDLSQLALSEEVSELQLKHPVTDEPLFTVDGEKVSIGLFGSASKQYRDAISVAQTKASKRGGKKPSPSETKAETIALLVAVTSYAKNFVYAGKLPATDADFTKLYNDPQYSWVLEQVAGGLNDTSNFLPQ